MGLPEEERQRQAQMSWDAALANAKRKQERTREMNMAKARKRIARNLELGRSKRCDILDCTNAANVFKHERWLCEEHQHG